MHIEGLHHAQITIPTGAEEEGRRFYCGIMGLVDIEKPEALRTARRLLAPGWRQAGPYWYRGWSRTLAVRRLTWL